MADGPSQVYAALDALGIRYDRYDHPPVFTGEEADRHWAGIPARGVKNLFLRNKKGNRHYLVILPIEKEADLRTLVKVIGDDRLSFASPERLMEHLGLTPGSVSPFGLLNNPSRSVQVVLDAELRGAGPLIFHPNLNAHSVTVSDTDLSRFLTSTGHAVRWLAL
jgi:Ala-tRNA(Pro) deacylase